MSEEKKIDSNKNVLIAVAVVVVIFAGYFVYKSTQKETVSIQLGDQKISATFDG